MNDKKSLTTTEAARYLGISHGTLRIWDKENVLKPSLRIGKQKHRRYSIDDLDKFLAANKESNEQKV